MERWVPLMEIIISKSPLPETEASDWLNYSFDASSSTTTITANSFITLLSKPVNAIIVPASSSYRSNRIMWMQTLPNAVQSRILSFLTVDYRKFCSRDLTELAKNILKEGEEVDFWVKKSAHQLLNKLSQPNYEWVSGLNLDSEEECVENEFDSLPTWLKEEANVINSPFLPWLPLTKEELNTRMSINSVGDDDTPMVEVEGVENRIGDYELMEIETLDGALNPYLEKKAAHLKTRILNFESTAETVGLANEIRQLCLEKGGESFKLLGLLEPWKADDETASILISNISDINNQELGWSSHALSSVILPKLLVLEEPASRVLMAAIIEYCKVHQRETSYALLYPLVFRKDGINKSVCDVLTRIIKECLHPAHVSAFCQKLLCGEEDGRKKFMCLPCHQCLISQELVWNEPLFSLFHNILNHNVHLTQDTIDQLVMRILESVERFSKSLKFGNFLLCLVNRCSSQLKSHKLLMIKAVEQTDTLVTKSMLSKLAAL